MVHLAPTTKTCTAEEAARLFTQHVFQYHGVPRVLISDRDTRFTSAFWRAFARQVGAETRFSTSFHPQTDGQTERMNRVLEEVMRHFINGEHSNWEELLPAVSFAINNAKSATTGETPFFLNYGAHPRTLESVPGCQSMPALGAVLRDMQSTLHRIKELYRSAQDRQKAFADKDRREHTFKGGDQVLLST